MMKVRTLAEPDTSSQRFTWKALVAFALLSASCSTPTSVPSIRTLVFTVQPSSVVAGTPISPAIEVTIEDAAGHAVTDFVGDVTLSLGNNPNGGTLTGTTSVAAQGGVAQFSNIKLDRAAINYTLLADAPGIASTTSSNFIVPGRNMSVLYSNENGSSGPGTATIVWLTPATAIELDTIPFPTGGTNTYLWFLPGFRTDTVYAYQRMCVRFVAPTDSVGTEYVIAWPPGGPWMEMGRFTTSPWSSDSTWGFDGTFLLPAGTSYNSGAIMQGC